MERPRRGPVWLGIDVACVLVFCAVGRRSHDEGLNIAGIASTAWPFLSGTALGWLAAQAWRRPTAVYPTGVVVWLCTVVVGMLLRKATSAGVAASFIVVASSVTALLLLGWRALAQPRRRASSRKGRRDHGANRQRHLGSGHQRRNDRHLGGDREGAGTPGGVDQRPLRRAVGQRRREGLFHQGGQRRAGSQRYR